MQKKIHARENLIKKNSCTPMKPKKYSCKGLKKIHTGNLITEKNSCGSKIPLPPHNFSDGPSLSSVTEVKLTDTSGCGEVFLIYREFKFPCHVSCFIRGVQAFLACVQTITKL